MNFFNSPSEFLKKKGMRTLFVFRKLKSCCTLPLLQFVPFYKKVTTAVWGTATAVQGETKDPSLMWISTSQINSFTINAITDVL